MEINISKINKFYVQKSSECHFLDFNGWLTIDDVSMTSLGTVIMELHNS
jgi:hypothetical protein